MTRTKLIDDLVAASVQNGCDRVLNLAAGFDTRPYRLDLPAGNGMDRGRSPRAHRRKAAPARPAIRRSCRLSRVAVDLADDTQSRSAFLADATSGARDALVITEGLLLYLNEAPGTGTRTTICIAPKYVGWITDVIAPGDSYEQDDAANARASTGRP